MAKIFISYRREDSENITGRIHDHLERHFSRENVFLDIDTIPFGADFRQHLDAAVAQCGVLLAVIGDGWLDARSPKGPREGKRRLDDPGDFVRIEIESALARGIPVIPVLVGNAQMPAEEDLPAKLKPLAFRNAAAVRPGRDFRDHVAHLIRGIGALFQQKEGRLGEAVWRNTLGNEMIRVSGDYLPAGSSPGQVLYAARTCVTNKDYLEFVKSGGQPPRIHPKYPDLRTWDDQNSFPSSFLLHPVVYVKHGDALAFCQWVTRKERETGMIDDRGEYGLPSLLEWRSFVKGSRLTAKTVLGREWPAGRCQPTETVDWETTNALGLQCLLGNVFEWCDDGDEKEMDLPNPSGPGMQRRKVQRFVAVGGGWASSRAWLQSEIDKGTFGAILCPHGWPMRDGGFRLCFRMKTARG